MQYSGTDEIASGTLAAISSNKATGALMDNAPTVVEENKSVKQKTVVKTNLKRQEGMIRAHADQERNLNNAAGVSSP